MEPKERERQHWMRDKRHHAEIKEGRELSFMSAAR